jgi:hypothetical protein
VKVGVNVYGLFSQSVILHEDGGALAEERKKKQMTLVDGCCVGKAYGTFPRKDRIIYSKQMSRGRRAPSTFLSGNDDNIYQNESTTTAWSVAIYSLSYNVASHLILSDVTVLAHSVLEVGKRVFVVLSSCWAPFIFSAPLAAGIGHDCSALLWFGTILAGAGGIAYSVATKSRSNITSTRSAEGESHEAIAQESGSIQTKKAVTLFNHDYKGPRSRLLAFAAATTAVVSVVLIASIISSGSTSFNAIQMVYCLK